MSKIDDLVKKVKDRQDKEYKLWETILYFDDKYKEKHLYNRLKLFADKHGYVFDDVYQNAYICYSELLDNFELSKIGDNSIQNAFLAYIHNYLFKRLHNYSDTYSLFKHPNKTVVSYNPYDEYEFLNKDFQVETIDNNFIDVLQIDNYYDKLSPREKEVYDLFKEGYDHGYIADKLDIHHHDVYNYKKRILEKVK